MRYIFCIFSALFFAFFSAVFSKNVIQIIISLIKWSYVIDDDGPYETTLSTAFSLSCENSEESTNA